MADAHSHAYHARRYAAIADALRYSSPASAGELVWLALVQAAQAKGYQRDTTDHTQSRRGIRNIVGRLPVNNNERVRLLNIANLVVTNLHGLAYCPVDIDERRHRTRIDLAKELVNILLRYA